MQDEGAQAQQKGEAILKQLTEKAKPGTHGNSKKQSKTSRMKDYIPKGYIRRGTKLINIDNINHEFISRKPQKTEAAILCELCHKPYLICEHRDLYTAMKTEVDRPEGDEDENLYELTPEEIAQIRERVEG